MSVHGQPDLPEGHGFQVPMMKEDRTGVEPPEAPLDLTDVLSTAAATATASEPVRWSPSETADTRQHTAGLRAFAGIDLEVPDESWRAYRVLQGKARELVLLAKTCETDAMSRILRWFLDTDLKDMMGFRQQVLDNENASDRAQEVARAELDVLESVASRLITLASTMEKS